MSEMIPTEAEVVARLARDADTPKPVNPTQLYTVPASDAGLQVRVLDLEKYLDEPNRTTGSVVLTQAESLRRYVDEHKLNASARAYANADLGQIAVVMNDHDAGEARWGDWRVTLNLRPSIGWTRWAGKDGVLLGQEDFAEHIEEGLLEITKPTGARMLEIVTSFHATNRATVDAAIRLDSGETQLTYVETIAARAGQKKNLQIPEFIELALAPFEGGSTYKVRARFRYRLRGSELLLGYKLERPEDVRIAAFDEVAAFFAQETGVPIFYGTPRALPSR